MEEFLPPLTFERLKKERDLDLGFSLSIDERFRLNLGFEQGAISIVARKVPSGALQFNELDLPPDEELHAIMREWWNRISDDFDHQIKNAGQIEDDQLKAGLKFKTPLAIFDDGRLCQLFRSGLDLRLEILQRQFVILHHRAPQQVLVSHGHVRRG